MNEPKIGDIAVCSRGQLGFITGGPVMVTYKKCSHCIEGWFRACNHRDLLNPCVWCKCEKGLAYVGFHLGEGMEGEPWCSRTPKVIGRLKDVLHA